MKKKVFINHKNLDSRMATAVGLHNEWIKWCEQNGIPAETIAKIPQLFILDKKL